MKNLFWIFAIFIAVGIPAAEARDTTYYLPIDQAMTSPGAKKALSLNVELHFADTEQIEFTENLGTFITNRKTNAFLKGDRQSCNWAMLSALKTLQERAVKEGGNAVIDIHSFYGANPYKNANKYECHAGATVTGVSLRGTVVKR